MSGAIGAFGGIALSAVAGATQAGWTALYQINPLFLTGGSFAGVPGGIFPFSLLAGAALDLTQDLIGGGSPWAWKVMAGGKMVSQSVATYPFASQQVAANATVQEPLAVSMLFRAPVNASFGYVTKTAILTALQTALTNHNNAGGAYTIFTPGLFYQNGLLLNVIDVTTEETKQLQVDWEFDFFFPLITQQAAGSGLSSAMSKLSGGQPFTGAPSWTALGV